MFYLYHVRHHGFSSLFGYLVRIASKLKGRTGKISHTAYGYEIGGVSLFLEMTDKDNVTERRLEDYLATNPKVKIYREEFRFFDLKKLEKFNFREIRDTKYGKVNTFDAWLDSPFLEKILRKFKDPRKKYCTHLAAAAGFAANVGKEAGIQVFQRLNISDLEPDELWELNLSKEVPKVIYDYEKNKKRY